MKETIVLRRAEALVARYRTITEPAIGEMLYGQREYLGALRQRIARNAARNPKARPDRRIGMSERVFRRCMGMMRVWEEKERGRMARLLAQPPVCEELLPPAAGQAAE